jgi:peroxiredoxin
VRVKKIKKRNSKQVMMKKSIYLFIAAALIAGCSSAPKAPHYNITGKITGADSITFILQKRVAGKTVKLDSAMAVKGEFSIKGGAVEYPELVTMMAKGKRAGFQFYLENADISVTGKMDSLYNAKVTGSKTQDDYIAFQKSLTPFEEKNNALNEEYKAAKAADDKAKIAEIEKKGETIYNEQNAFIKEFVKSHPASYIVPGLIQNLSYEMEVNDLDKMVNALDTSVAKVSTIVDLKKRIEVMKSVAVGQKAPDFTLNDVNDKPLALSSKIGKSKLLLIDFWASWCGPCRAENPNVVKVWKEYNKKGFDVFGVSLDRPGEKENWLKAIKDDQLTWTHVSDLQWWACAAAKLYAVNSIPANFLLDDKGTIIARNLRGDDLAAKVKELLTTKK